jgi:16S rRNA (cytosine967-C5)-methyltransferase
LTPADRLHTCQELLTEVLTSSRPIDAITSGYFRAHREIDEEARGAILAQLYALLRHQARLGWWLARLGRADTPRHRIMAWLVLGEGLGLDQLRRLGAEASFLKSLPKGEIDHPDMPEALRLECPDWALGPLQRRFGDQFASEMAAMLLPPPIDLRVNPVKATRDGVLRSLQAQGLDARPTPFAAHGIRLAERLALGKLDGLKRGEFEIQDEGSQLVAALVAARPGERVVDFCAGAGGKSLALAAQMANRGHLIACDISEARLKRCAERLRAAGLHNAETRVLSSETDRWIKRHKLSYDRVLVDAPCSGTGTWRRNPDARGRAPDLGLGGLVALQGRILASAARLVKPGGRLVYATCSVLHEENEAQVEAFLAAHPAFALVRPEGMASAHPDYLVLTPAQHNTDGFFAAAFERAAA